MGINSKEVTKAMRHEHSTQSLRNHGINVTKTKIRCQIENSDILSHLIILQKVKGARNQDRNTQ